MMKCIEGEGSLRDRREQDHCLSYSPLEGSLQIGGTILLHPQVIEKEGRKEFVVLPYKEFLEIQEALEDLEDLRELRKEQDESLDASSRNLREIGKELGFEPE